MKKKHGGFNVTVRFANGEEITYEPPCLLFVEDEEGVVAYADVQMGPEDTALFFLQVMARLGEATHNFCHWWLDLLNNEAPTAS